MLLDLTTTQLGATDQERITLQSWRMWHLTSKVHLHSCQCYSCFLCNHLSLHLIQVMGLLYLSQRKMLNICEPNILDIWLRICFPPLQYLQDKANAKDVERIPLLAQRLQRTLWNNFSRETNQEAFFLPFPVQFHTGIRKENCNHI